jgi:gluconokinase
VPHVLAIDLGTSSIRATVYDSHPRPVKAATHVRYAWRVGADGSIDAPAATVERAVAQAIDGALKSVRQPIAAVSTAAFWHSLIGVDASGRAITPVLPWSDTRSVAQAVALRDQLDEAAVHQRTGCRLHASYWPARLRWFAAQDARTFRRVRRWLTFPAYLNARWLGRAIESRSQASGTGMFVHRTSQWDPELVAACHVTPDHFAPIVDLDHDYDVLPAATARRWPALREARWIPPIGDGASNNIGADCTDVGHAALMIGTSGALRSIWNTAQAPDVPLGLWRYWLDRQRVVVGGALSNGGNLFAWLRETLGLTDDTRIEARIARLAPDGHGLTMLPFLAGDRGPDALPHARGAINGLRLSTSRDEIVRAGLEAVAYRFAPLLDLLTRVKKVDRIVASGAALSASRVWPQILADVLNHPIHVPRDAELTSRGAAILGLERLGVTPRTLQPAIVRVARPNRRNHRIYRAAAARQQQLLAALGR